MRQSNHTHKYIMITTSHKKKVYKCVSCPSSINSIEQALGRETICWSCGNITVIQRTRNGFHVKPHCLPSCAKQEKVKLNLDELFERMDK